MLLEILQTIKEQRIIAHAHLARLFQIEDSFLIDILNVLHKKKLISIEHKNSKSDCISQCKSCTVLEMYSNTSNNCYYKIV